MCGAPGRSYIARLRFNGMVRGAENAACASYLAGSDLLYSVPGPAPAWGLPWADLCPGLGPHRQLFRHLTFPIFGRLTFGICDLWTADI